MATATRKGTKNQTQTHAAELSEKLLAWLARIKGEIIAVSDKMSPKRFEGALTAAECSELDHALDVAYRAIENATPRRMPAELAELLGAMDSEKK